MRRANGVALLLIAGAACAQDPEPSRTLTPGKGVELTATAPARNGDPIIHLLNANSCTVCHQIDKRVVGPSFREVAAKYAADSTAATVLARKIKQGGSGVWGAELMPPNTGVSDAEILQLVDWILRQK